MLSRPRRRKRKIISGRRLGKKVRKDILIRRTRKERELEKWESKKSKLYEASNAERERDMRDTQYDGSYARVGGRARARTRALVVASLHR